MHKHSIIIRQRNIYPKLIKQDNVFFNIKRNFFSIIILKIFFEFFYKFFIWIINVSFWWRCFYCYFIGIRVNIIVSLKNAFKIKYPIFFNIIYYRKIIRKWIRKFYFIFSFFASIFKFFHKFIEIIFWKFFSQRIQVWFFYL